MGGEALAFVPLPFLAAPGPALRDPASDRTRGISRFLIFYATSRTEGETEAGDAAGGRFLGSPRGGMKHIFGGDAGGVRAPRASALPPPQAGAPCSEAPSSPSLGLKTHTAQGRSLHVQWQQVRGLVLLRRHLGVCGTGRPGPRFPHGGRAWPLGRGPLRPRHGLASDGAAAPRRLGRAGAAGAAGLRGPVPTGRERGGQSSRDGQEGYTNALEEVCPSV